MQSRSANVLVVFLAGFACACTSGKQVRKEAGPVDGRMLEMQSAHRYGGALTAKRVAKMEKMVRKNPADLVTRLGLIKYYMREYYAGERNVSAGEKRVKHIVWFVENHPEIDLGHSARIKMSDAPEVFAKVKKLWVQQVQKHDNDPKVLGNAAQFFFVDEQILAEKYLRQVRTMEPMNASWAKQLGFLYLMQAKRADDEARKSLAAKSLAEYEQVRAVTEDEKIRLGIADDVVEAAYLAGAIAKAEKYAEEVIGSASEDTDGGNHGRRSRQVRFAYEIHHCNSTLGKIALDAGDIDGARARLAAAGAVTRNSMLAIFGPDVSLARRMLDGGEKKAVLDYLESCISLWRGGVSCLKRWRDEIGEGKRPDFDKSKCR